MVGSWSRKSGGVLGSAFGLGGLSLSCDRLETFHVEVVWHVLGVCLEGCLAKTVRHDPCVVSVHIKANAHSADPYVFVSHRYHIGITSEAVSAKHK